jgi:putative membrane protein
MMGGLGMLLPLLFLIGLVVLIVWAVDRGIPDRGSREGETPHRQGRSAEEVLKERFARGEIDAEEYEERHRVLREDAPATHR